MHFSSMSTYVYVGLARGSEHNEHRVTAEGFRISSIGKLLQAQNILNLLPHASKYFSVSVIV